MATTPTLTTTPDMERERERERVERLRHFHHFHDVRDFALTGHGRDLTRPITIRYGLYGAIPPAPTPTSDQLRSYVTARRFLRQHDEEVLAYRDARAPLMEELDALEEAQGYRYSKARARQIERLTRRLEALEAAVDWEVQTTYEAHIHFLQTFRQAYYGCWFGTRRRRDFADNWARSYGASLGRLDEMTPAVRAYTDHRMATDPAPDPVPDATTPPPHRA